MQTSKVGGRSVTLHTAVAVNPARPLGPSVVMMLTAPASIAIALRKVSTSATVFSLGRLAHEKATIDIPGGTIDETRVPRGEPDNQIGHELRVVAPEEVAGRGEAPLPAETPPPVPVEEWRKLTVPLG